MTTYEPPKKNTAYIFYPSLVSQANTKIMQANPTIAAGDFKVSIDGGALNNLATLPVVTPAGSKLVKVDLSAAEMNGDNISIVCSDAAGAEWCDLTINLHTTVRQTDDLMYPTVSGRSTDVTATGAVGIDWANVENPTTALNLSGTNIDPDQVVASVSGAVGSVTTVSDKTGYALSVGGVQAIWDALTSALTTVGSVGKAIADNLTGNAFTRLGAPAGASVSADIAAVQAKTTNLPTDPADQSAVETAITAATSGLATAAALTLVDDFLDTEVAAIKLKTDLIPAAPAAVGDAMTLTTGERTSIATAILIGCIGCHADNGLP